LRVGTRNTCKFGSLRFDESVKGPRIIYKISDDKIYMVSV